MAVEVPTSKIVGTQWGYLLCLGSSLVERRPEEASVGGSIPPPGTLRLVPTYSRDSLSVKTESKYPERNSRDIFGHLAQLVERRFYIPQVGGSSPSVATVLTRLLNSLLDPIPPLTPWLIVPAIFFLGLLAVGIYLSFKFKPTHGLQEKLRGYWSNAVWTAGAIGFLSLGLRSLGTPWLGSNLVLGLVIVGFAVWALLIYAWQRKGYREELELHERRKRHEQYLL